MRDFTYYAPTRVFFGKEKHKEVGKIIKEYGYNKIMLQYGKNSIKKTGLYDQVMKALSDAEIEVVEMGGVEPNPKLSFVREAVRVAKETGVQLILAVGGGSAIDSAKATAVGAVHDRDIWEFSLGKSVPEKSLPVGCILTLAAAGSEMSGSSVITNMEENMKRGFTCDTNRCLFSICNPELTYTVNWFHTACGVVDIMAHTMERYFTPCEDTLITDRIAEAVLKTVIDAGKVLKENPYDYDARANMMWASSLSHNNLTSCGRAAALPVHQLEHGLSGEFDHIAHGAGLAVLFPAWARYIYKENIPRFARFAREVWGVSEQDDEAAAVMGIESMAEYFKYIDMPSTLREFDIEREDIPRLCDLTTFLRTRSVKSYIDMDYDVIREIYESCY